MKIAINTLAAADSATGGGYTIMSNLLPRLVDIDRSNDYCLIVSAQNRSTFEVEREDVSYMVLPAWIHRGPLRLLADNAIVPLLIRKVGADLYFSPNDYLPFWLSCPAVVGAFNLLYYQPPDAMAWAASSRLERWHRRARRLYYRAVTPKSLLRANKVVAISEETRRVILENVSGLRKENVAVVYPGVPRALMSLRMRDGNVGKEHREPTEPFILSTSAISPYKNYDLLIRSFAIFTERFGPTHQLVIVGRSYYPSYGNELRALASRLGVGDRVIFPGFVTLAELVRLYEEASVFVLLSSCESFGFPALEAMAFGRPVIVSNMSSLMEIVGDGGLTVDPEDVEAVSFLMHAVVSDAKLSATLRRRAMERAKAFSWDVAARALIEVFAEAHCEGRVGQPGRSSVTP